MAEWIAFKVPEWASILLFLVLLPVLMLKVSGWCGGRFRAGNAVTTTTRPV